MQKVYEKPIVEIVKFEEKAKVTKQNDTNL